MLKELKNRNGTLDTTWVRWCARSIEDRHPLRLPLFDFFSAVKIKEICLLFLKMKKQRNLGFWDVGCGNFE